MSNENESEKTYELAPGSAELEAAFPKLVGREVFGHNLWKAVVTLFPTEPGGQEVVGLSLFFQGGTGDEPNLVLYLDLVLAQGLSEQLAEVCSWASSHP